MKGIVNRALTIALLMSVCGVRAEGIVDLSSKPLFIATATKVLKGVEGGVRALLGNAIVSSKPIFDKAVNSTLQIAKNVQDFCGRKKVEVGIVSACVTIILFDLYLERSALKKKEAMQKAEDEDF